MLKRSDIQTKSSAPAKVFHEDQKQSIDAVDVARDARQHGVEQVWRKADRPAAALLQRAPAASNPAAVSAISGSVAE